jgi:hypothetical protein
MLCVLGLDAPAEANWLTKILREAGEAGGGAARHTGHGLDNLSGVARHLKVLPHDPKSLALAAHATPEGHWKFTNRNGDVFTAANPNEMARVVKSLAPEHAGDGNLKLYLSEDSVFARSEMIKDLPASSELYMVVSGRSYRLRADPAKAGGRGYLAEVKPNLSIRLGERRLFDEALWHLERPLSKSGIRVVSLEPGAAQTLSTVPRFETQSKAALIDRIDPWKLPAALSSIRGQTLVVTGRLEGEFFHFRPASGGERSLLIGDLKKAATEADVNLVVLEASDPLQPGGRNWFWQKVEVKGLDAALKRADFADFLDALGAHRQAMVVEAREGLPGRVSFNVKPVNTGVSAVLEQPMTDTLMSWTEQTFLEALGNVITSGLQADLRDMARQQELDRRILPGIPSVLQFLYIAGLVLGIAGHACVSHWWARLWPKEERAEYSSALGYYAARTVRVVVLVLMFTPLVGIPAGLWVGLTSLLGQVWFIITLPFRAVQWVWRQIVPVRV